jgi:hypothetical protein
MRPESLAIFSLHVTFVSYVRDALYSLIVAIHVPLKFPLKAPLYEPRKHCNTVS